MDTERGNENEAIKNARLMAGPQQVLFAQGTDNGRVIGVVTDAPSSSLMLLAAGVEGVAARRALRARRNPPERVIHLVAGKNTPQNRLWRRRSGAGKMKPSLD